MIEIRGLGGAAFEEALAHFRAGEPVSYRGMELLLRGVDFECRVPAAEPSVDDATGDATGGANAGAVTDRRALDLLTKARFKLGALLASAPPLEAIVGNREPHLLLVTPGSPPIPLFELRGDRLRRLPRTDG